MTLSLRGTSKVRFGSHRLWIPRCGAVVGLLGRSPGRVGADMRLPWIARSVGRGGRGCRSLPLLAYGVRVASVVAS